jgi:DNA-binding winged helix-turn-helix (wHTH) protein
MISLDVLSGHFIYKNKIISKLSKSECLILYHFFTHPDILIPKEQLLTVGWPDSIVTQNSLAVAIKNIRVVIANTNSQIMIKTIHRQGYIFNSNGNLFSLINEPIEDTGEIRVGNETPDIVTVNLPTSNLSVRNRIKVIFFVAVYLMCILSSVFIYNAKVPFICKHINNAIACGTFKLSHTEEVILKNKINLFKGICYYGYQGSLSTIEIHCMD